MEMNLGKGDVVYYLTIVSSVASHNVLMPPPPSIAQMRNRKVLGVTSEGSHRYLSFASLIR
jgi:hypothetical protein